MSSTLTIVVGSRELFYIEIGYQVISLFLDPPNKQNLQNEGGSKNKPPLFLPLASYPLMGGLRIRISPDVPLGPP